MEDIKRTRDKARKILGVYCKLEKNIRVIEKKILGLAEKESGGPEVLARKYNEILLQIAYLFQTGSTVKQVAAVLRESKINYNHEDFALTRDKQKEYDDYLNQPFQVKKGLLPCEKCKSERTMSYFQQDRGGDEGTSVYSQCFDCHHKWRMNN